MKKITKRMISFAMVLAMMFTILGVSSIAETLEEFKPTVSVAGYDRVKLSWNKPEVADGAIKYYRVVRANSADGNYTASTSFIETKSATVTGLTYGKTNYFRVRAYDAKKKWLRTSSIVTKNTNEKFYPTSKAVGFTRIKLYWGKPILTNGEAKYYRVFYSTSGKKGTFHVGVNYTTSLSGTTKGLKYGQKYYLLVNAYDANKTRLATSVVVNNNTNTVKMNTPKAVCVNNYTSCPVICFNTIPDADGYELYIKLDKNEVTEINHDGWAYKRYGYNKWFNFKTSHSLIPKGKYCMAKELDWSSKLRNTNSEWHYNNIEWENPGYNVNGGLHIAKTCDYDNSNISVSFECFLDNTFPSFKLYAYKKINGKKTFSKVSNVLPSYSGYKEFHFDNRLCKEGYEIVGEKGLCLLLSSSKCVMDFYVRGKVLTTKDGKISTTTVNGKKYVNYCNLLWKEKDNYNPSNLRVKYFYYSGAYGTFNEIKKPANVPSINKNEIPYFMY